MENYYSTQKVIFESLLLRQKEDPTFTFSVRRKFGGDAKESIFIGTLKSKYFGFTLWRIPFNKPAASSDLMDYFIQFKADSFNIYFEYNMTKAPFNDQNKWNLSLHKSIIEVLKENNIEYILKDRTSVDIKIVFEISSKNINELITNINLFINKTKPLIDEAILRNKKKYPDWTCNPIDPTDFKNDIQKFLNKISGTPGQLHQSNNLKYNLNTILYGPPGTGKTYATINHALSIIKEKTKADLDSKDRSKLKEDFAKYQQEGIIQFITFHQSLNYEEFIEGIKPIEPENEGDNLIYKVEPGVFRCLCINAAFSIVELSKVEQTETLFDFSQQYEHFIRRIEDQLLNNKVVRLETKSGGEVIVDEISQQGNVIIKHIEGTRKYTVSKARLSKLNAKIDDLDNISNINEEFREIMGGSNSSAYWSVLNALRQEKLVKPDIKNPRTYTFEEKKEIVASLKPSDYKDKKGKPYILIIDEINRGNVSQIFGELITLIEEDKRLGNKEYLETILPYSKEVFGVPNNVYIIGTMNTADRSVEAIDTALRRRFVFKEMMPEYSILTPEATLHNLLWEYAKVDWEEEPYVSKETALKEFYEISSDWDDTKEDLWNKFEKEGRKTTQLSELEGFIQSELRLNHVLSTINRRIEILIDRDHLIGHSYFVGISSYEQLYNVFYNNIIPLLKEYFFNDFAKIGLVLGKEFVQADIISDASKVLADFPYENKGDFDDKTMYLINHFDFGNNLPEFKSAINKLNINPK